MKTTPVYILNGTENVDADTPTSPFQGKTLSEFRRNEDGTWATVLRNGDGTPNLGYLAKEISAEEASKWKHRIQMAKDSTTRGYIDPEGHWFSGQANNSVLKLDAWNKWKVFQKDSYYKSGAIKMIDKLADTVMESNHPRGVEYEARYAEAKKFLESGDQNSELYQYLAQLQYKGLSLKEAAELVISKYEKANSLDVVISGLRMKKALLKGNLPLSEKEELYNAIVAGLNSAKM